MNLMLLGVRWLILVWYEKQSEVWAVLTVEPVQQRHFRVPELFSVVCQIPTEYDGFGAPYEGTHYLNIITAPPKVRRVGSRDATPADYDITEIFVKLRVLRYSHVSELYRVHPDTEGQVSLWQG